MGDCNGLEPKQAWVLRGRYGSRGVWMSAAAAPLVGAAVIAFVFLYTPLHDRLFQPSSIETLVNATKSLRERSIEVRVVGGFPWRQHRVSRGARDSDLSLMIAASKVQLAVEKKPTEANRRALATSYLMRRYAREAVDVLETLLRENTGKHNLAEAISVSTDASLLTDLTAAWLAHDAATGASNDASLALHAVDRAWALHQTPELAWNFAIAAERLNLVQDAKQRWEEYLRLDPSSPWATEARSRLSRLNSGSSSMSDREWQKAHLAAALRDSDSGALKAIVAAAPRLSRAYVEENLLSQLATAVSARTDALRGAARIAAELSGSGDPLLRDIVGRIEVLSSQPDSDAQLQNALRSMAAARQSLEANDSLRAVEQFEVAEHQLAQLACPLSYSAGIEQVVVRFGMGEYHDALARIARLESRLTEGQPYDAIAARLGWLRGLCLVMLGRPYEALASYERALPAAERIGDRDTAAALHALIAQNLELVGTFARSWEHRRAAFRLAAECENPERLSYVLAEAVAAAVESRRTGVARVLFDRMMAPGGPPVSMALATGSLVWRARQYALSGQAAEADADLARARELLTRIPVAEERERAQAIVDLAEGTILAARAPQRAIGRLDAVLQFYRKTDEHLQVAQLLASRATAHAASQRPDLARGDIESGIAEMERQRAMAADPAARAEFLDAGRALYDQAVRLAVSSGKAEEAFCLAERGRARALSSPTRALAIAELRARLQPDSAILTYYGLGDVTLLWTVTRETFELAKIPAGATAIAELVGDVTRAGRQGDAKAFRRHAARAKRLLIGPVAELIRGKKRLLIVPDAELVHLPFSALTDGTTYLFQQYEIVITPDAGVILRAQSGPPATNRVAAFISTSFRNPQFPDLPSLRSVRDEALTLSRLFPGSAILEDHQSTGSAFLRALSTYDIIHFAGHAVQGSHSDYSALLLAGDATRTEILYAHEIRAARASRARLVVLAGCDTIAVDGRRGNAGLPLSYAFFEAGVPAVIGSLWPVDDRATADLMSRFYAHFAAGESIAGALRSAKLDLVVRAAAGAPLDTTWIAWELTGAEQNREERQTNGQALWQSFQTPGERGGAGGPGRAVSGDGRVSERLHHGNLRRGPSKGGAVSPDHHAARRRPAAVS